MLGTAFARATIPVEDVDRASKFYVEVLGLEKVWDMPGYAATFEAGQGSQIIAYRRGRATAENTAITFDVDDLEKTVDALIAKGVTMEQYDMPQLETNAKGIAESDGRKMAWLKDPEGNILGLMEKSAASQ